jgi:DDE domain
MMAERGLSLAHTTIMRWVQHYTPEFEKRWHRHTLAVGGSWRVDETYVKIKGVWHYLYRAVDRALAIYAVVVATLVYGLQVKQAYPGFVARHVRVGTFVDAPVTSFVILYLTRSWGWTVALASAIIGTAAAPMIFEFPFDLIVMTRTNPPIPTHPMLYRQLFFLPLFLVQFSTVSLLTLLPSMRVTAHASYAVAGMFVVFAVWAASGSPFLRSRFRSR